MRFVPKQSWKEIDQRRSERYSKHGRLMEREVIDFLKEVSDGENKVFEEVEHHPQGSREDNEGKDITVGRKVNGTLQKRSFGITISLQRFHKTKNKHPGIPVFHTPIGFNRENLLSKVLQLFDRSFRSEE